MFLAGHFVAMVTYRVTKMITICSLRVRHFFDDIIVRDSSLFRAPPYPPCAGRVISRPCALRSLCGALFVCRRKVCSLIVRFYLLDVDILILGLEMPKKYVSCCFWLHICIAFFCNFDSCFGSSRKLYISLFQLFRDTK